MDLEWDEAKRRWILQARGFDFADIDRFDPESVITFSDERRNYGESRFISTGYLDGVLCSFCWTPRNGKVRIISMRKVNARERKAYETFAKKAADAR